MHSHVFSTAEAEALAALPPRALPEWVYRRTFAPRRRTLSRSQPQPLWSAQDVVALRALQLVRDRAQAPIAVGAPALQTLLQHVRADGGRRIRQHTLVMAEERHPSKPSAWALVRPGDALPPAAFAIPVDELVQRAQEDVDRALPAVIAARKAPGRPQRERTALRLAGAPEPAAA